MGVLLTIVIVLLVLLIGLYVLGDVVAKNRNREVADSMSHALEDVMAKNRNREVADSMSHALEDVMATNRNREVADSLHSQHKDILFLVSLSPERIFDLDKKKNNFPYLINEFSYLSNMIELFTNGFFRESIDFIIDYLYNNDYSSLLDVIKNFSNVDYRESISRENLAIANQYKMVIIVGHRKGDSLELSNRSLFPMADLVTSLPPNFSGVIDVSVRNSNVIRDAIKMRCPNALVQTVNEKTGIEIRIPLYSLLLNHLPANINYRDVYLLLLEMDQYQDSIPKQEIDHDSVPQEDDLEETKGYSYSCSPMYRDIDRQEEADFDSGSVIDDFIPLQEDVMEEAEYDSCPIYRERVRPEETDFDSSSEIDNDGFPQEEVLEKPEPGSSPEIDLGSDLQEDVIEKSAHLPQKEIDERPTTAELRGVDAAPTKRMVSISAPESVTRGYTFLIQVFMHYDSEKGTIEIIAKWRDHNTKSPLQLKTIRDIHKGDIIDIKLSMMDVAIQPTNLILVCDKEHSYTKRITISDELIDEEFEVCVKEDYCFSECWARLEIRNSDASEIIKTFCFIITIKEDDCPHKFRVNSLDFGNGTTSPDWRLFGATHDEQSGNPVPKCFNFDSVFVRQNVKAIVSEFYRNKAANLALIEIAFFDHNLISTRNSHKTFIETLVAWGAITCADVENTANAMSYKMRKVPEDSYKDWKGYVNDKKTCTNIGKKLESMMSYPRKKEV